MVNVVTLLDLKTQALGQAYQHRARGVAHKVSFGQFYSTPSITVIEREGDNAPGFEFAIDLSEVYPDQFKWFVMEKIHYQTESKLGIREISQEHLLTVVFSHSVSSQSPLIFRGKLGQAVLQ